ncbi:RNA binding protein [Babesia ovata]|uniref:RNA binding protein n=1 Tax=Babesia ovata TaxID=189622 RepID=A0A2H6KBW4_9APIC|nr:RNA binding protein [Babesia ovata]GBE60477.1 RNA binding protein [Babesia ovata]
MMAGLRQPGGRESQPSRRQGRFRVSYNPDEVYDPMFPNDYERLSNEEAQRARQPPSRVELKFANVEPVKLSAEEAHARRLKLLEEAERGESSGAPPQPSSQGPKDIGLRIMQKLGWTEGKGLGAKEQGIVAPLVGKNVGKHVGVIVQAAAPAIKRSTAVSATARNSRATESSSKGDDAGSVQEVETSIPVQALKSRILKLEGTECPKTVEEVQEDFEESMCQFGSLMNVLVQSDGVGSQFTVYCEFEDTSQAVDASRNLQQAINGYNVVPSFVTEDEYTAL